MCNSASSLVTPPPVVAPGPSPEDVRKVIADYQARESKKAESTKSSSDTKDKDDNEKTKESSTPPPPTPVPVPVPTPAAIASPQPTSTHRKFALHRSIFEMRKSELKRREQAGKAKEVSKGGWIGFSDCGISDD